MYVWAWRFLRSFALAVWFARAHAHLELRAPNKRRLALDAAVRVALEAKFGVELLAKKDWIKAQAIEIANGASLDERARRCVCRSRPFYKWRSADRSGKDVCHC